MTNERLLYCLNGVDERFILKANPARRYVRPQFRLAALAACLCLIFGGIFAVVRQIVPSAPFDPSLPHVSLPETLSEEGGGGSGLGTYFDGDSLICSLLPDERELPEALPVYRSGVFSPDGTVRGLTKAGMRERLEQALSALEPDTAPLPPYVFGDDRTPSLNVKAAGTSVRVTADGTVDITFDNGLPLPDRYVFRSDSSDAEALASLGWLTERYSDLLGFAEPSPFTTASRLYSGEAQRSYLVCDASCGGIIVGYSLRCARFFPDENGALKRILLTDGLTAAEKLGDYPLITEKEAENKLIAGKYLSLSPIRVPGRKYILGADIVYLNGPGVQTLMPFYRFYVCLPYELLPEELERTPLGTAKENGLKVCGIYYVPAIDGRYISRG